jgi:hypothetical protein
VERGISDAVRNTIRDTMQLYAAIHHHKSLFSSSHIHITPMFQWSDFRIPLIGCFTNYRPSALW